MIFLKTEKEDGMQEPEDRLAQELRKSRIWGMVSVVVNIGSMVVQVWLYIALNVLHIPDYLS
jgi:hypothetical protein